jgi:type II secretory pathway pseudopilin PulG
MESVLIVITLVSLAMTIALGAILARLLRNERRRSDARVAVLREMADASALQVQTLEPADDFDLSLATDVPRAADLFVRAEPRSAWPRRLAVVATIAVIVTVAAGALRSRATPPASAGGATTRTASAQTAGLLELLSLKQTQGTGALTITGLVQNPRDGAVLSNVKATALLFGPDGTFLASGGAALDFTVLRPGDESPFVINVPVTSTVARYRVGFRSEDGHVIGHVDRRTAAAMASGREPVSPRPRGAS